MSKALTVHDAMQNFSETADSIAEFNRRKANRRGDTLGNDNQDSKNFDAPRKGSSNNPQGFCDAIKPPVKNGSSESNDDGLTAEQIRQLVLDMTKDRPDIPISFENTGRGIPINQIADSGASGGPLINSKTGNGDGGNDASRHFQKLIDSAPATIVNLQESSFGLSRVPQRDLSEAQQFLRENRDALRSGMESMGRKLGMFGGSTSRLMSGSDAATLKTDIPDLLLDFLSMEIRESKSARYIFNQFSVQRFELGRGPGDTMRVARFPWLTEPSALGDRTLTPGTATDSNIVPVTEKFISVVLKELGRGTSSAPPLALTAFFTAYSAMDLISIAQRLLGHDWMATIDLAHRAIFATASTVVYNDKNSVTATPANVATGDNGTMTRQFLIALHGYLLAQQIPPLSDGCYAIIMPPAALTTYLQDVSTYDRFNGDISQSSMSHISEVLAMGARTNQSAMGQVVGYYGCRDGMHIFSSNAYGTGAAGTEGVQNTTLGVGATLTRTSYAFGSDVMAHATGLNMEIRRNTNDDFQRLDSFIWYSHEGFAEMDINANGTTGTELRMVQVRTTDIAV